MGTDSRSPIGRLLGNRRFLSLPFLPSWKKTFDNASTRPKGWGWLGNGREIGKGCCDKPAVPLFDPVAFFSRGKTRGEAGNALTMRNGRCCVFAQAGVNASRVPFTPFFSLFLFFLSLFFLMPRCRNERR